MNIYLICTGNTCRSPMAEAILRSKKIDGMVVRSAGIYAQDGWPISQHAQVLIDEADMPHTPVSRAVTQEDLEWADLILTMTEAHKSALLHVNPAVERKTFTLKGFVQAEKDGDVYDPFGGDLETYRHTFTELSRIIDQLEQKLAEGK
ncbi:low molecular weight protein arginine phosphatase [Sporosarcina soli]|uniref:Low molecular weight protein arginine phosphatase n=1 Tax=Sporosarcina soli TaxID=334736 RepID=A0ABW0TL43_9BACL